VAWRCCRYWRLAGINRCLCRGVNRWTCCCIGRRSRNCSRFLENERVRSKNCTNSLYHFDQIALTTPFMKVRQINNPLGIHMSVVWFDHHLRCGCYDTHRWAGRMVIPKIYAEWHKITVTLIKHLHSSVKFKEFLSSCRECSYRWSEVRIRRHSSFSIAVTQKQEMSSVPLEAEKKSSCHVNRTFVAVKDPAKDDSETD
jgi:hypothetical protein